MCGGPPDSASAVISLEMQGNLDGDLGYSVNSYSWEKGGFLGMGKSGEWAKVRC